MPTGKYIVKVAQSQPELFVMVWMEDGIPIQTDVQMTEAELRAALFKTGRTEAEVEQVILEARENAA